MRLSAPVHHLKRRAKLLARKDHIPLHAALDRIAREEGFASWSLLASRLAHTTPPDSQLAQMAEGELVLLAARPGHGKTTQGLKILLEAARQGRRAVLYTLEYTEDEARARLRSLAPERPEEVTRIEIETSDDISAAYIMRHLHQAGRGTVALIDYLQLLDQQRHKPALAMQLQALRRFAATRGLVLIFISQIDRAFTTAARDMPRLADLRQPNPVPQELFAKACFLHEGEIRWQAL